MAVLAGVVLTKREGHLLPKAKLQYKTDPCSTKPCVSGCVPSQTHLEEKRNESFM
jgi:hypothetical protein